MDIKTTSQCLINSNATSQSEIKTNDMKLESADCQEYTIEALLSKRFSSNGAIEYLVKWEGYGSEYNTWEPEENILGLRLIQQYERKQVLKAMANKASGKKAGRKPKENNKPEHEISYNMK